MDVPMALRMLEISEEEYKKRQGPNYADVINTKKNRESLRHCILNNLASYYGVAYDDLEFDQEENRKKLNFWLGKLLGKSQSSFVIGRIPSPPPRKRPRCKSIKLFLLELANFVSNPCT